jgi:hypothetical protein
LATTRAINVPLACGAESAGRGEVVAVVPGSLGVYVSVDGVGDGGVGAACLVLVDERGAFAVVTHPGHEIPEPCAACRRKCVPSVSQVVEMQTRCSDRRDGLRPGRGAVEVAPAQRAALGAGEGECAWSWFGEGGQVVTQVRDDDAGDADDAAAGLGLGRAEDEFSVDRSA